jgi:hypothetical protein
MDGQKRDTSCPKLSGAVHKRSIAVKQGYRLILVDKDGVLVSEFQLTENDFADSEAFVAMLKLAIEQVEEEEL